MRHAFIRNGPYFLTDLVVYADGMVDCWGLVTVEELAAKLASGWVATTFEEGAEGFVHDVVGWKFSEPRTWVTAEMLLGGVRDDIDRLNKRPDSVRRVLMVAEEFRRDPSEQNRAALLAAYLAIPGHRRRSALGDMDCKDRPFKVLAYGVGARPWGDDRPAVTEEDHRWALDHFAERERAAIASSARTEPDGQARQVSTLDIVPKLHVHDWPDPPGVMALRNEYPAPVTAGGDIFPTVEHAYWALSTSDQAQRAAIAAAATPLEAAGIGKAAPRRDGWEQARTAVMATLLRAKFSQHPQLAWILTETGTAVITYNQFDSQFWGSPRNWMGRLLELARAEPALQNLGMAVSR
jgi:predicted NAD-dependent protein-ADP-ribosyltransferase YbiA (DUF1768 family)